MAGGNWTFWLNMTNYTLAVITLLAVLVVIAAVGQDLFSIWLHKIRKSDRVDLRSVNIGRIMSDVRADWGTSPHTLTVPGLGLTMADGGEKVDPSDEQREEESRRK